MATSFEDVAEIVEVTGVRPVNPLGELPYDSAPASNVQLLPAC